MPAVTGLRFPQLSASNLALERAYRIAVADLLGNIQPFQDGLLGNPQPVILAGLDYDTPWTRDAAINVWNGLGLFWPQVARNTLLSVLERRDNRIEIGGQYWDSIIWTLGAWAFFLQTGDRDFLALAREAVHNSLARREMEEFDSEYGLFLGPAVYGDGVAAYPDRYATAGTSSILDWVSANPSFRRGSGYGLPMMALSTNCVYFRAYQLAEQMARELSLPPHPSFQARAAALEENIKARFWIPALKRYRYLVDWAGGCDFEEGLGHALVLLFDLAGDWQAGQVIANQHTTPAGIPCVWPSFERYTRLGGYGRHSGTVWPFISALWSEAGLKYQQPQIFEREFDILTTLINRHAQCAEIYHPQTGQVYGGLQEGGSEPDGMQWLSCARQSWTASAYLRMILNTLAGLRLTPQGIEFCPYLPAGINSLRIEGLVYRDCELTLDIRGQGSRIDRFARNGGLQTPSLPADARGLQTIEIWLA